MNNTTEIKINISTIYLLTHLFTHFIFEICIFIARGLYMHVCAT